LSKSTSANFDALIKETFESPLKYEFWPALEKHSQKLLIILHGRGDSIEGFHWFPAALGLDNINTLFLQAPDKYGTGFSWYDLAPNQGPGIIRSRHLIFQLLDDLSSKLGIVLENIFLMGFSQGCLMCLDVALRYPHFLNGIIGISGFLFFEDEYPGAFSRIAREQHFFISHGYQDDVLPIERTKNSVEFLKKEGIAIDWSPFHKTHTVDEVEEIPLIREFISKLMEAN